MVNSQDGYGYLGDLCVPGYNLTTAGPDADNRKWRVVCKAPSKIVAIVMAMNMSGGGTPPQGEFLQIRRRGLKGVTNTFQGLTLEKNSVLFAHVGYGGGASETSPFRLAYFCASKTIASHELCTRYPCICAYACRLKKKGILISWAIDISCLIGSLSIAVCGKSGWGLMGGLVVSGHLPSSPQLLG